MIKEEQQSGTYLLIKIYCGACITAARYRKWDSGGDLG